MPHHMWHAPVPNVNLLGPLFYWESMKSGESAGGVPHKFNCLPLFSSPLIFLFLKHLHHELYTTVPTTPTTHHRTAWVQRARSARHQRWFWNDMWHSFIQQSGQARQGYLTGWKFDRDFDFQGYAGSEFNFGRCCLGRRWEEKIRDLFEPYCIIIMRCDHLIISLLCNDLCTIMNIKHMMIM